MWDIKRGPHWIGPCRWQWVASNTAHGIVMGYAWTHWQARHRLLRAERELFGWTL